MRAIAAHIRSSPSIGASQKTLRDCGRSQSPARLVFLAASANNNTRTYSTKTSMPSNPMPASFLRGGTSKGVFLRRSDLPEDRESWARIFLGIMGSPDPEHGRQLNGMGGSVSSLSKICVVGLPSTETKSILRSKSKAESSGDLESESEAEAIDVEYTFAQIGIRDSVVDYSGNCGNLSSMVGVYAVDEGLCRPRISTSESESESDSQGKRRVVGVVRSFNTNTQKRIDTRFPVDDDGEPVLDLPETTMAGVPGHASRIDLHFVDPAGAKTGTLLPSGHATDSLAFNFKSDIDSRPREYSVVASLVDAANPSIFILAQDLARILSCHPAQIEYSDGKVEALVEAIRQSGARAMGLDPRVQAQPKIAILSPSSSSSDGTGVVAHSFSMGVLHRAIPMTLGLCLGVAARTEGTLAWQLVRDSPSQLAELVRIRHPSGEVDVGAEIDSDGVVKSAKVIRTGRRLMKGWVWW